MANRTVKDAAQIKGTNPQHLVEKIIRSRIYESRYWKEDCFALTAELLVDKAMELKYIGGVYGGNVKPTPFLCLVLKMLQIAPEKDIIIEFIKNEDFKYVRYLGAFYMRLTGTSLDIFKYLEPLYVDYRKMKKLNRQGKFELVHMDELIDDLLRAEKVCDIALPRLQKRHVLEELNQLEIKISPLDENLDELDESSEGEEGEDKTKDPEPKQEEKPVIKESRKRSKSREREKKDKRSHKYVDYDNPREEDDYDRHSNRRRNRSRSSSRRRYDDDEYRRHKKSHKHKRSRTRSRSRSKSEERTKKSKHKEKKRKSKERSRERRSD